MILINLKKLITLIPLFKNYRKKLLHTKAIYPVLFVLSFIFFSLNLSHEAVCVDEAFALFLSNHSISEMEHYIAETQADMNLPGFYTFTKIIHIFAGNNIIIFRFIAVITASTLVTLLFFFVKKIFELKIAVITFLLLLFNPGIHFLAAEYSVYVFSLLLFILCLFSLLLAI